MTTDNQAVEYLEKMLVPNPSKAPYRLEKPSDTLVSKVLLETVTNAWVKKHTGEPWVIMQLDMTNFLQATWAVSKDKVTTKRYGIAHSTMGATGRNDLRGTVDKFKVALNTLAIIEYSQNFSISSAVDALIATADVSVVVPASSADSLKRPTRVLTLAP